MNTQRSFIQQFATFWFGIETPKPKGAQEPERQDDPVTEAAWGVWERAVKVLDQTHNKHPAFNKTVIEDGMELQIPQWEFCNQNGENVEVANGPDGTSLFAISFYTERQPFTFEQLKILRALCQDALEQQADGASIRYSRAETDTSHHQTVRETVDLA